MQSILSRVLPLAADPFPPTHKAGSEFEGFFLRLESHSGRTHAAQPSTSPQPRAQTANGSSKYTAKSKAQSSSPATARSSPSRIPRLARSSPANSPSKTAHTRLPQLRQRRLRSSSTSSESSARSAASASSGADPPSPTPASRRISLARAPAAPAAGGTGSSQTQQQMMLTAIDPVFDSPESYIAHPLGLDGSAKQSVRAKGADARSLPTSSPADLILVVCELQSAPIDQRICIYMRWIVHGEEAALNEALHSPNRYDDGDRLPHNAESKDKARSRDSFEIIRYIPAWQLELGARASADSVQPFRVELPAGAGEVDGNSFGFLQVAADGNVVVDLTLPNPHKSSTTRRVATKVRVRSTKFAPWHPKAARGVMGSRGPEGWIQHLGAALPLHWYVHTSSAPAMFSLEHVVRSDSGEASAGMELADAVAAGRALLHVEKNWGHGFPSGWMWAHGATPLPDPSLPLPGPSQPAVRLSLAGGSILGLTAFLVGIHIRPDQAAGEIDWNFTPPFALGPQHAFAGSGSERIHRGVGFTLRRDFARKTLELDVWDAVRWASIRIAGAPETFATQIPGPCSGGWKPAYCHHSYRCQAHITLYRRSPVSVLTAPLRAARHPWESAKALARLQLPSHGLGWNEIIDVRLDDRVALEFGGDFAQ